MKEEIWKEILFDLTQAVKILRVKEAKDRGELKELSDHAIEDVALHKDLDLISMTVLLYSLYKIDACISKEDSRTILEEMEQALQGLEKRNLGKYNQHIKNIFKMIKSCNAKVKEHLNDVMHAARIKKGTALLEKGLSIGQAAGLMGLSNWDLQQYVGKTNIQEHEHEAVHAEQRVKNALQIFKVT